MRQLLYDLGSGALTLAPFPVGLAAPGKVWVRVRRSVISTGTERMLFSFGQANLLDKARAHPERVKQVLQKLQAEGIIATMEAIEGRLATPLPLGYSCAGEVIAVGAGVQELEVGDRVACNGPHAEAVHVSARLCAKLPETLDEDRAAFASVAAIALNAVRLAQLTLGERALVVGMGLLGQLAAALLRAQGCEVVGVERDEARAEKASKTHQIAVHSPDSFDASGFDAALLCVDSSDPSPLTLAATACRRHGRVVVLGTSAIQLDRRVLHERELSVQVASAHGPGRYERDYEERGVDYPVAHVRWTAQRNMEACLALMARGALDPLELVEHTLDFDTIQTGYTHALSLDPPPLATLITYAAAREQEAPRATLALRPEGAPLRGELGLGVIGAGLYAQRTFLPALRNVERVHPQIIASPGGTSAAWLGEREGFSLASAEVEAVFQDPRVALVALLTRHDSHAALTEAAVHAGKAVFVEKPLARAHEELAHLEEVVRAAQGWVMVGFNRRFAPMTQRLREALDVLDGPRTVLITVNAGRLPREHWLHDASQGGRIIGEGCHFIDLARALCGAPISGVQATRCGPEDDPGALISLTFSDGSSARIDYLTDGPAGLSKERVEVFCQGRAARIEGWRVMRSWGWPGLSARLTWRQDKGHEAMLRATIEALRAGEAPPIPFEELLEVSRATLDAAAMSR